MAMDFPADLAPSLRWYWTDKTFSVLARFSVFGVIHIPFNMTYGDAKKILSCYLLPKELNMTTDMVGLRMAQDPMVMEEFNLILQEIKDHKKITDLVNTFN